MNPNPLIDALVELTPWFGTPKRLGHLMTRYVGEDQLQRRPALIARYFMSKPIRKELAVHHVKISKTKDGFIKLERDNLL